MKPIISVEQLGKRYAVRHKAADAPTNFRELPAYLLRKLLKGEVKTQAKDFWALKDVSFDIMPGERVGIIGRNGAGKSTLLKLLSRITEPTTGRITMHGRVGSLLEVGTGFHSELTGRENIYLNGAVLGMSRAEVAREFDKIVDFAGVEEFLDMPVKRYSSGMYVRLGFAVAAHLQPEILIVDEVLAVGDAEFQKKCLGAMKEASKGEGRTVLFVSHDIRMIEALCDRALLVESAHLILDAPTSGVVRRYLGRDEIGSAVDFSQAKPQKDAKAHLLRATLTRTDGTPAKDFDLNEPICIRMEYEIFEDTDVPVVPKLHFTDINGIYLCVDTMLGVQHGKAGKYTVCCTIPRHLFNAGQVHVGLALDLYSKAGLINLFYYYDAISFNIQEDIINNPDRYGYARQIPGFFRPKFVWSGGLL